MFTIERLSKAVDAIIKQNEAHEQDNDDELELKELARHLTSYDLASLVSDKALISLKKFYHKRWLRIIDSDKDYFACRRGVNRMLVELARNLASEEVIDENYFILLMPGIKNTHSAVTKEPLWEYALDKLILSDDKVHLLHIEPSYDDFLSNKRFVHFEINASGQEYSSAELVRLGRANGVLAKKYKDEIAPSLPRIKDTCRLTLATVLKIKELVEKSCIVEGAYKEEVPKEKLARTEAAYHEFFAYLDRLTPVEHDALFSQYIEVTGSTGQTFGKLWTNVVSGRACATHASKYYIKLVLDYIADEPFTSPLAQTWIARGLGDSLAKKLYMPELDEHIDYEDRCKKLIFYLLTHDFSGSESISLAGAQSKVSREIKQVFNELMRVPSHKNWQYAYCCAIAKVQEMLITHPSTRKHETQGWLTSIASGDFWKTEHEVGLTTIDTIIKIILIKKESFPEIDRDKLISLRSRYEIEPSWANRLILTNTLFLAKKKFSTIQQEMVDEAMKSAHDFDLKRAALKTLTKKLALKEETVPRLIFFSTTESTVDASVYRQLRKALNLDALPAEVDKALVAFFKQIISNAELSVLCNIDYARTWLMELGIKATALDVVPKASSVLA